MTILDYFFLTNVNFLLIMTEPGQDSFNRYIRAFGSEQINVQHS